MKRATKLTALLLAVLLLLFTAIACLPAPAAVNGSDSREDEATASEAAEGETGGTTEPALPAVDLTKAMDPAERTPQTLEVWYAVSGTSGEKFTEQAAAFDEANDLVSLNLSYSGGSNDTATKVSAALLTGTEPDVALMYAGPSFTGSLGNFDMAQLVQREGFNKDDIYPGIWDYCKYFNGEICAVPYGISTPVMYYNKDILAAAGVDMNQPPEDLGRVLRRMPQVPRKGQRQRQWTASRRSM